MKNPTRVTVRARAKINLDLRILGRRADGYHELRTIFQALTWHDTVTVSRVPRYRFEIRICGMPLAP